MGYCLKVIDSQSSGIANGTVFASRSKAVRGMPRNTSMVVQDLNDNTKYEIKLAVSTYSFRPLGASNRPEARRTGRTAFRVVDGETSGIDVGYVAPGKRPLVRLMPHYSTALVEDVATGNKFQFVRRGRMFSVRSK